MTFCCCLIKCFGWQWVVLPLVLLSRHNRPRHQSTGDWCTLTLTLAPSWQGVSPVHSSTLVCRNSGEDVNTKISYCDWLQLIFIPAERRWGRYQSDSLYFICCCQPATSKIKKNHNKFVTRQDRESSDSTSIYWRGSLVRILEFFKSNFHLDIPLVTILFLVCCIWDVNCQAALIYLGEHKHSLMNMKLKTRLECATVAKYFF